MRRLIFTDVHANLPALRAVLSDAGHWDEAWFLGDIIGWGPHPVACIELMQEIDGHRIIGNHDRAALVMAKHDQKVSYWDRWTREQLDERHLAILRNMKPSFTENISGRPVVCLHKQPHGYYLSPQISPEEMAAAFSGLQGDQFVCGHSHHLIERAYEGKPYCCVRAVGQSRDRDPRAGYTIEENGRLYHKRVAYDVDLLLHDLALIGLEASILTRWSRFIKTGYDPDWSRM